MQIFTAEYASQHLEQLLDLVARGETVMLSLDGRPTARLVAIDADGDGDAEVPLSEVEEAFHGD
jgi:antitoxin (DNA-binding transcriptional repressor) of toxin-antitoxin stability system